MKEYFANLEKDEIAGALCQKKEQFYRYLQESGRLALYKRVYDQAYRAYDTGGQLYWSGEQGEYTNMDLNDFKNILLHLHVLTTDQEPSFEPHAANTDTKSMAQTILARGLLDYYLDVKKLQRYINKASKAAISYGDGWVGLDWNSTIGDEYAVGPDGNVVREGDVEGGYFNPMDVILDVTNYDPDKRDWIITRTFRNKYLIAAKYAPEPAKGKKDDEETKKLRDEILAVDSVGEWEEESVFHTDKFTEVDCDNIPVYTFYHRKCEAVPKGRMVKFLGSHIVLTDGPLPFKDIPAYRMAPEDQEGTPFGYTIAFDLLPLQEALDRLISVVLTNQSTFGISNILIPDGSNISYSLLADGLNAIGYNPGTGGFKPEALNLTNTPAEIFKTIELIRAVMQTLSGVNSVARGEPEASLKSGSALALVQSMAIKFNSGLQRSYAELASDVGTGLIQILQSFARSKRVAAIAGKANRRYMRHWQASDIDKITRVIVDLGNPLMRTTAGRVNLADTLLDAGKIDTAEQYIQVLTTGRFEPIIEGKQAELMNIRAENEALAEGRDVQAIDTDAHALHIREHKVVLASPEARRDPALVKATLNHIQEHITALKTVDVNTLAIIGEQPIPPDPAPNPSVPPLPEGTDQTSGEALSGSVPVSEPGVRAPNLPNMPTNPLTGEEFDSSTGGLA